MAKIAAGLFTLQALAGGRLALGLGKAAMGFKTLSTTLGPIGVMLKGLNATAAAIGLSALSLTAIAAGVGVVGLGFALKKMGDAAYKAGKQTAKAFAGDLVADSYMEVLERLAIIRNEIDRHTMEMEKKDNLFAKVFIQPFTSGDENALGYMDQLYEETRLAANQIKKIDDALAGAYLQSQTGTSANIGLDHYPR